ncbi:MAG: molybdopterin biosynthesis protein, partial [Archaeoglobaceae archaeon]
MAAGSDIMAGELILRKDSTITARDVAILSAVGIKEVKVSRKPVVAIISTGNEVVEPGKELGHGKIYDVNSPALCSAVRENGGEPLYLGIAEDDYDKIKAKIKEGLKAADMVLASGGTSAGVGDLMHRIIEEEGKVLVHGIAVKPGKPTIIAEIDGKPVFGLPGYPVSAMMIFEIFVAHLIRRIAGLQEEERAFRTKISHKIFSSSGRREFLPVNIVGESIYPVTGNYSAAVSKLVEADGFIEIPDETIFLEEGEYTEVKLFSTLRPADLLIIGSHCVGIDVLLELMRREHPWVVKVINVGSSGGLVAIRRGESDIAGTHLLDEETGEYNIPFISRFGLQNVLLVKGYAREQGLIVKKGNPQGIESVEDLLRENVSIINRNPGSGTRILLDMYLKEIAHSKVLDLEEMVKKIEGYSMEAKSHTAVATGVLMDKADVGMGIKTAADRYGLDFIPLRDEEYDFVIRKDRVDKEAVEQFISTLRSSEFKEVLEKKLPGMRITEQTGKVTEF